MEKNKISSSPTAVVAPLSIHKEMHFVALMYSVYSVYYSELQNKTVERRPILYVLYVLYDIFIDSYSNVIKSKL